MKFYIILATIFCWWLLSSTANAQPPSASEQAEKLYNQAGEYHNAGEFDKAIEYYTKTIELANEHAGAYYGRATIYWQQEKYALAISDLRKVNLLAPEFATAYGQLGWYLVLQGKFDEAREACQKACALEPDSFAWTVNLGHTFLLTGDATTAREYYRQALALLKSEEQFTTGPVADFELFLKKGWQVEACQRELEWMKVAFEKAQRWNSLNAKVLALHKQGQYKEATHIAEEALEIAKEVFGQSHPDVATSLNNLAGLYYHQGRYAQAEPLYKRALAIQEKAFGKDHPDVATSLNNLAELYHTQGKYSDAEPLYKRALEIFEKARRPADVATALNNLAELYRDQGKYTDAESLHKRALEIMNKALREAHLNVAHYLNNLALLYHSQGKYSEAEALVERSIGILDATTGYPDGRVSAYALRARLRKQKGDLDGALEDLAEALASIEKLRLQIGGGEETRAGFFEKYTDSFDLMVAWQLEAGDIEKAIEYAERGRARVLLDQLAAGKIDIRQSIPEDIRVPLEKREANAKARLAEYQQRITLMRSRKDLSDEERLKQIAQLEKELRVKAPQKLILATGSTKDLSSVMRHRLPHFITSSVVPPG